VAYLLLTLTNATSMMKLEHCDWNHPPGPEWPSGPALQRME